MSTRSKRKQEAQVSYAEVDSDQDMPSDEERKVVVTRKKGKGKQVESDDDDEAFEATGQSTSDSRKHKKQKSRGPSPPPATPEPAPPTYNAKLLLDLPLDLFLEICSHLHGNELLRLAQVNKALREIMLSKETESVWPARRRKDGFDLPQGYSELEFALFNYANNCQTCGKKIHSSSNAFLRVHHCWTCAEEQTIVSKGIETAWPELRSQALKCVRFDGDDTRTRRKPPVLTYLISDLVKVNDRLAELEEEDEITVSKIQSMRSKGSSTRSRGGGQAHIALPKADALERYVMEKQEWVRQEREASLAIEKNRVRLKKQAEQDRKDRVAARSAARAAFLKSLEADYGWTDEEVSRHLMGMNEYQFAPKVTIEEDPDAWEAYHETLKEQISNEAERLAKAAALDQRQALVEPYYRTLESEKSKWTVFPSLKNFFSFKQVRPFWEPVNSTIDDESWKKAQSNIIKELDDYQEKNRVEAIRQILAANQGVTSIASFSKDPGDYPESTYDSDFFARSTSLFVTKVKISYRTNLTISPFPLTTEDGDYTGPATLKARINVRQVHLMRAMVEAAGLDPEDTYAPDLDALGKKFQWRNAPNQHRKERKCDWTEIIAAVTRYGPSNAKIVGGEKIEIKYCSSKSIIADSSSEDGQNDDEEKQEEDDEGEGDEDDEEKELGDSENEEEEDEA